MAKCAYCGADVPQTEGKRAKLYCNDKCRMAFVRKASITERKPLTKPLTNITEQKPIKATSGVCWCCGAEIPKGTVCCGPCAWSGRAERAGSYPPLLTDRTPEQMEIDLNSLTLTGDCQMTDYEREHYKPASELAKGEHNPVRPVSKPGQERIDAHYAGVCDDSRFDDRRIK